MEIVDRCRFSLDELAYQYHEEALIPGMTAQQSLEHYTWEGIKSRYPEGLPAHVEKTIRHELALLETMKYAPYFLTVFSIVRYTDRRAFYARAAIGRQFRRLLCAPNHLNRP
ncbi:error-prone DNA polymerase [Rhizobium tibeticum]|uniref:Error-prone DNA polymerase n=1 Tax=Rhizobium tibeticum TaxID=501024 RepID=A0A1H8WTM7_9HYPH|nr:Error-prone DNA polymerase [Rhizobium tibeticum]SEP30833.1 error-prone DNA polymerase [Rhizobium tibeticum]